MGPEAFRQSGSRRRTGLRDTAMTRPPAGRLLPMTIDRGENVPVEARHPDPAASARILPRTGPGHPRRASARVYACDIDGLIVRVNRLACELWGRSPKLLDTAQRFCGSFRVESLDGDFIPPSENTHGAGGARRRGFEGAEAVVQNPDGKRWVARVNVAPPRDEDGPVVGAINCFQDVTLKHDVRQAMERQQRTFDLAMTASQIGTWRYIMTDNICVYDDNAQRLYGLTEARFLRDEDGVKAKFHPDDMKVMRARVAKALDPEGDGRYDVVYRVKQLDGSCR
jgi:PAS domain-containing protein